MREKLDAELKQLDTDSNRAQPRRAGLFVVRAAGLRLGLTLPDADFDSADLVGGPFSALRNINTAASAARFARSVSPRISIKKRLGIWARGLPTSCARVDAFRAQIEQFRAKLTSGGSLFD